MSFDMELVGCKFVLPFFDASLKTHTEFALCEGVTIINLSDVYRKRIRAFPEMAARYESRLDEMQSAISIMPEKVNGLSKDLTILMEMAVFCAMSLRLATGLPIDTPFWFDVREDDNIEGSGISQMRTYRTGNLYRYPLDQGPQAEGLEVLQIGFGPIFNSRISSDIANPLIRAIEFASIAFQTRHLHPRVVNNTIFLEALFSSSNSEIAYQISASVSWYLESKGDRGDRIGLFKEIKKLYGLRSKIVHGSNLKNNGKEIRDAVEFSEMLNTRIFRRVLRQKHSNIFDLKDEDRREQLTLLLLGASCKFID